MQVVVRTVNFIQTITISLTAFSVIRRFFYVGKLKTLCANNHFQIRLSLNFLHKNQGMKTVGSCQYL